MDQSLQALGQLLKPFKHPCIDTVTRARPFDFTLNQAGGFEVFQMLADGGLRQGQPLNDIATNTTVYFL
jgi:hypothetical protein